MEGWFKVHRRITENKLWLAERFTKAQAWIDLILLANHKTKPETFFIRGNEVNLKRGELGYAITTLARRWKWNERTVNKFLSMLQKDEMIHYRKSSITTVITIKNYDLYQGNTEQTTEQSKNRLQNRLQTNKNEKNEKKKTIIEDIPPLPSELSEIQGFPDLWMDWIQSRREVKKPLTPTAVKRQFNQLIKFKEKGYDLLKVVDTSIQRRWQGFFEPQENNFRYRNNGHKEADVLDDY